MREFLFNENRGRKTTFYASLGWNKQEGIAKNSGLDRYSGRLNVNHKIGSMGEVGRKFVPLLAGIFIYIFSMNIMGLIPGFDAPTANLNSTVCMALFVLLFYNAVGLWKWKAHYVHHFTGPSKFLIPLMFPLEIVSHLSRPVSLSLRLFGNIRGEEIVMILFFVMAPILGTIPIYALFLLGKSMQAFVFFILTMVYIKGALEAPEH